MKRTFALVKKMARKMKSYSHKAIDWFRQTSGLSGAKQLATYAIPFRRAPKILIVAPGLLPIPPSGWGAVELLTHETAIELSNKFHVTVLNSRSLWSWISVLRNRYVAAVVHYEEMVAPTSLVRALRFRDRPILFCSHYGYLDQPMKWNPEFRRKFGKALKHLRKTDYFLALSPSIAKVVREMTQAQTIYSPNGSSLTPVHRARGGGGLLILGKVEDRKRQFEVVSALRAEFPLTCVGPIADARVENLLRSQVDKSLREIFVGPWSRAEVAERLSSYDVLLLPSEAEADALVLYEAQLAGLSIIVCSRAIGSQDPTLPWVHSVDDLEDLGLLKTTVSTAIRNNPKLRSQIVKHAEDTYRWRERLKAVDFLLEVGL
jgi:glycosyltransferase involved in cell wall biosynthesis